MVVAEIKQLSLFVENRPGRMAKVSKTLSDAGVNIRAMTIAEAGDFGVIRMVVDDPEKGYKVLHDNGFTVSTTDVLTVEMKDTPGGLYEIVNTLGENNINVDYAYAFVTAKAQKAMLILRVDNIAKARQVLSVKGVKIATKEEIQAI
ncbi:MAG: ACT domain-containing protein [Methanotrichaceae archaeon]